MQSESRLIQNLEELMSLYRHHLDLFWKWITLYVSIVTLLMAYVFNGDLLLETRRLFPILIAVVFAFESGGKISNGCTG